MVVAHPYKTLYISFQFIPRKLVDDQLHKYKIFVLRLSYKEIGKKYVLGFLLLCLEAP